jgi:hypothetical protein
MDPFERFNPATLLSLSQARTWISNVMSWSFYIFSDLRREVIVDIGGIVDLHCLNSLFITLQLKNLMI